MFDTLTHALIELPTPWRVGGAAMVALVFAADLVRAVRRARAEPDGPTVELRRLRHLVAGPRAVLVGGCAALVGAGLLLDAGALVGLALIIGLEELYETTMVLGLLRWGLRVETQAAAATDSATGAAPYAPTSPV